MNDKESREDLTEHDKQQNNTFAIKKITQLKNVGRFSTLEQKNDFQYGQQNCNIIFGFNGSGKTTLSNALSLFANDSFISTSEKTTLFDDMKNDAAVTIELELQNGNKCKYSTAKQPKKDIYVFNSHFVAAHVFDGTKGKLKKFSNVAIKNETIEKLNNKIADLEKEKEDLEKINEVLNEKNEEITKKYSSDFSKILMDTNKRLTPPKLEATLPSEASDELNKKLESLKVDYNLNIKQEDLSNDLSKLEGLGFQRNSLDLNKVSAMLEKSVQQLSKEVLANKIKDLVEDTQKQKVEIWFRFGKNVLDAAKKDGRQTKCPICDTDISVRLDDILKNFNGYLDKGYEDFITELETSKNEIYAAINLVNQCENNAKELSALWKKYKTQMEGQTFASFDFNVVKTDLETILKACESKLANIHFSFTIQPSTFVLMSEINTAIAGLDSLKQSLQRALNPKKLNRQKIENEIRNTYYKIILLEFDQLNNGGNLEKYNQNQKGCYTIKISTVKN